MAATPNRHADGDTDTRLHVSVVVPVRNEAANIGPLLDELDKALADLIPFEVIYVNDGSTDTTAAELIKAKSIYPWLRVLTHAQTYGQSAAVRTGVLQAQGPLVVTLDGDGQNDPATIGTFLQRLMQAGPSCGLVQGYRRVRQDSWGKQLQSKWGNLVWSLVLGLGIQDTGCGLRCFPKKVYLELPYFDGLHRFMPALVARERYDVVTLPVVDRPRHAGRSNYGFFDRLWVACVDLLGVWWLLQRRYKVPPPRES